MKRYLLSTCLLFLLNMAAGQIIVIIPFGPIVKAIVPEHGFLPGKKFTYYPAVNKYDLQNRHYRVEVYDWRDSLQLKKVDCSEYWFSNTSEFTSPDCIHLLAKYIDTLFTQSNAVIDSSAADTIRVHLEGIDGRLIGAGKITAHGLCQLNVDINGERKKYCIDITDADKNSPIGKNAFVTRKTATRVIVSAAMRGVVEDLLKDLSAPK